MEPVYKLKAKYTAPKTKGRYRSKSNDQGKSTRKKMGAKVGPGDSMLVLTAEGRKVWRRISDGG